MHVTTKQNTYFDSFLINDGCVHLQNGCLDSARRGQHGEADVDGVGSLCVQNKDLLLGQAVMALRRASRVKGDEKRHGAVRRTSTQTARGGTAIGESEKQLPSDVSTANHDNNCVVKLQWLCVVEEERRDKIMRGEDTLPSRS